MISDIAENRRSEYDSKFLIPGTAMFIDPKAATWNAKAHQTIFMFSLKQAIGTDSVSEILSENAHLNLKYPYKTHMQDLS